MNINYFQYQIAIENVDSFSLMTRHTWEDKREATREKVIRFQMLFVFELYMNKNN